METRFVTPQEIDTQVISYPQCVDNQAVPQDLFEKIARDRNLNLELFLDANASGVHEGEAGQFWEFQKREYNRALLYSKKVVVNRTAFWNNPVFISAILGNEKSSLLELLENQVIMPFMVLEKSFDEEPATGFGKLSQGKRAMKELVNSLNSITGIRLASTYDENENWFGVMDGRFHTEFTQPLYKANPRGFLARPAKTLLGTNIEDEVTDELINQMFAVANFVDKNKGSQPRRNGIYREFIIQPGTEPEFGKYRPDRFAFQIKQWVDSIYNSNGPAMLGVLTFTPYRFPTPYDLLVSWSYNPGVRSRVVQGDSDFIDEILDRAKTNLQFEKQWNAFMKNADLAIPDPHELTHGDILEIREWDEWKAMIGGLETFLENPRSRENFLILYNEFNKKLGSWAALNRTAKQISKIETGIPFVSVLYKFIKGFELGMLIGPGITLPYSSQYKLPDLANEDIKGILEIGLLFINQKGVDWKRSQNIRQVQKAVKITHDDLRKLWDQLEDIKRHLPSDVLELKKSLQATATNEDYS